MKKIMILIMILCILIQVFFVMDFPQTTSNIEETQVQIEEENKNYTIKEIAMWVIIGLLSVHAIIEGKLMSDGKLKKSTLNRSPLGYMWCDFFDNRKKNNIEKIIDIDKEGVKNE